MRLAHDCETRRKDRNSGTLDGCIPCVFRKDLSSTETDWNSSGTAPDHQTFGLSRWFKPERDSGEIVLECAYRDHEHPADGEGQYGQPKAG